MTRHGEQPTRSAVHPAGRPVEIRPMTAADLGAARRLWRTSPGIGLNESDSPANLRTFLGRNPGLSQVARQGRRLLGAVLCGHEGRRGYLHHLAVAPEARRTGIGKRLVTACLESLADLGIPKCSLFLFANNESGLAFWQRLGWRDRRDLVILQAPVPRPRPRRR